MVQVLHVGEWPKASEVRPLPATGECPRSRPERREWVEHPDTMFNHFAIRSGLGMTNGMRHCPLT